jgi:hypothetical protein
MLSVLAELQRQLILANARDGLAARDALSNPAEQAAADRLIAARLLEDDDGFLQPTPLAEASTSLCLCFLLQLPASRLHSGLSDAGADEPLRGASRRSLWLADCLKCPSSSSRSSPTTARSRPGCDVLAAQGTAGLTSSRPAGPVLPQAGRRGLLERLEIPAARICWKRHASPSPRCGHELSAVGSDELTQLRPSLMWVAEEVVQRVADGDKGETRGRRIWPRRSNRRSFLTSYAHDGLKLRVRNVWPIDDRAQAQTDQRLLIGRQPRESCLGRLDVIRHRPNHGVKCRKPVDAGMIDDRQPSYRAKPPRGHSPACEPCRPSAKKSRRRIVL